MPDSRPDRRKEIAKSLREALRNQKARGVLLAGAGGTGLRTFAREESPTALPKIEVALLPNHNLTEGLVAVIQVVANYGLSAYFDGIWTTQTKKPKSILAKWLSKIGINIEDELTSEVDMKTVCENIAEKLANAKGVNAEDYDLYERSYEILENFIVASKRAEQTLTFSSEHSVVEKEQSESKISAEFSMKSVVLQLLAISAAGKIGSSFAFRRTIEEGLARGTSAVYSPYTPAIASHTLNRLFNSLCDVLKPDLTNNRRHAPMAILVLHMEKYPLEHAVELLATLREVTREHSSVFPLLVTGGLDLYVQWRDGIRNERNHLRPVFDRVLILPPTKPEGMVSHLQDLKLGDEDATGAIFNAPAFLGCGIYQLTKHLFLEKKQKAFVRPHGGACDAKTNRRNNWKELGDAFEAFVEHNHPGHDPDAQTHGETYAARVMFIYDILNEVDRRWPELCVGNSFDPSILINGDAVARHKVRKIGEPVSRLLTDFFGDVVPVLQECAGVGSRGIGGTDKDEGASTEEGAQEVFMKLDLPADEVAQDNATDSRRPG